MSRKPKGVKRHAGPGFKSAQPGGFWDRSHPKEEVLSVRHSTSRIARSLAFLRRIVGMGPKGD